MFWRAILSYYNLFTSHLVADRTTNISAQRDVPLPNSSPMTWRMSSHLSPGCSTLPVHHGTQIGYETPADAVCGPMTNVFSTPDRRLFREKIFFFLALNDFHLAPTKRRKRSKHVLARSNCPRVFKCWRPSLRLIAIVTCWGERVLDKREKMGGRFIAPQKRLFESSPPPLVLFPSHQPVVCVCVFIIRYKAQVFIFPKTTRSSTNQPREWQGEKLFCATRQVGHSPALFISFDVLEHIRDFPLSFVGTPFISGCCCRWWLLYSVPWKRRRRRRWRPGPSLFGPDGAWISVCAPGRPGARDGTLRERERNKNRRKERGESTKIGHDLVRPTCGGSPSQAHAQRFWISLKRRNGRRPYTSPPPPTRPVLARPAHPHWPPRWPISGRMLIAC